MLTMPHAVGSTLSRLFTNHRRQTENLNRMGHIFLFHLIRTHEGEQENPAPAPFPFAWLPGGYPLRLFPEKVADSCDNPAHRPVTAYYMVNKSGPEVGGKACPETAPSCSCRRLRGCSVTAPTAIAITAIAAAAVTAAAAAVAARFAAPAAAIELSAAISAPSVAAANMAAVFARAEASADASAAAAASSAILAAAGAGTTVGLRPSSVAFEDILQKISDGLSKKNCTKNPDKIQERIGRAKEKYKRAAQLYDIELTLDEQKENIVAINWTKTPKSVSAMSNPGVYCLRTTLKDMNDASLWKVYSMLTNLEAVFRSLKTDLGLRPVYHQIERRVEGHLFISVLAYYVVHTMRLRLKAKGVNDSWDSLRNTLSSQVRITATLQRRDGRTIHIRKASRPEPNQQIIYGALGLTGNPGGIQRIVV